MGEQDLQFNQFLEYSNQMQNQASHTIRNSSKHSLPRLGAGGSCRILVAPIS